MENFTINEENLIRNNFIKKESYPLGEIWTNSSYFKKGTCLFECGQGAWMVEFIEPQGNGKIVRTIKEAIEHEKNL